MLELRVESKLYFACILSYWKRVSLLSLLFSYLLLLPGALSTKELSSFHSPNHQQEQEEKRLHQHYNRRNYPGARSSSHPLMMINDSPFELESIKQAMDKMQRGKTSQTQINLPKNLNFPPLPKKTFLQVLAESYENHKPGFVQIHHSLSEFSNWNLQVSGRRSDVGITNQMLKKESLFELRSQIFNPDYFIIENVISCMCLCMDSSGELYTNSVEFAQQNSECLFYIPSPKYTSDLYTISSVEHSNASHTFVLGWGASFLGTYLPSESFRDQRLLSNSFKFMFVPVAFKELLSVMEIDLILKLYKVNKRLFEYCPSILTSSPSKAKKKKTCSIRETFLSRNRGSRKKCRRKKRQSCISGLKSLSPSAAKNKCNRRYKLKECEVLHTHAQRNRKKSYVKEVKKRCHCIIKKRPRATRGLMLRLMNSNPCQRT